MTGWSPITSGRLHLPIQTQWCWMDSTTQHHCNGKIRYMWQGGESSKKTRLAIDDCCSCYLSLNPARGDKRQHSQREGSRNCSKMNVIFFSTNYGGFEPVWTIPINIPMLNHGITRDATSAILLPQSHCDAEVHFHPKNSRAASLLLFCSQKHCAIRAVSGILSWARVTKMPRKENSSCEWVSLVHVQMPGISLLGASGVLLEVCT